MSPGTAMIVTLVGGLYIRSEVGACEMLVGGSKYGGVRWGLPASLGGVFLCFFSCLCEDSGGWCSVLAPGGGELRDPNPAFEVKLAFSCSRYSRGGRGGGGGYCGVLSDTVSYVLPLVFPFFFLLWAAYSLCSG